MAGGPDQETEHEERAHRLERRDDGHGDERQQGEVGGARAQAEAARLGLVEREHEEGAVAEHAAHEHERGGGRLHPDVGPRDAEHVAEQEALDVGGERPALGDDDHAERQHPDEEQPDARVLAEPGAAVHEADARRP